MTEQPKKAPFTWHENVVALLLAGVGGSIDAIGYLMFAGLFMGFMSGNSTLLGLNAGHQHWVKAGHFIFTILLFLLGVMVGARLPNRRLVQALALEAGLVAIVLGWQVWGSFNPTTQEAVYLFPRVALLAATMGIQAGALRKVGIQSIHTTFVTGDLTSLGALLTSRAVAPGADQAAQLAKADAKGMLVGVWVLYVLGAAAGAVAFGYHAQGALLLPLCLLVAALGISVRWPESTTV